MDKYNLGATLPKTFHTRLPFSVGELKQQNPREEAVAPLRKNFSSPVRSLLTLKTRNVAKELELYFKR